MKIPKKHVTFKKKQNFSYRKYKSIHRIFVRVLNFRGFEYPWFKILNLSLQSVAVKYTRV